MRSTPYQSLVSLLSNILEAYTTALFVLDPKSRRLNLAASQTLSKYLPDRLSMPLEESGILAQVQKVGQVIHIDKVHEAASSLTSTVPIYRDGESHIKGLYAVPIGDGAGVLYVDTKYGWGFNDKQQKWIRQIGEVIRDLMVHEQKTARKKDSTRIIDFWQRVDAAAFQGHTLEEYSRAVVCDCAELIESEYGFILLKEPGEDSFRTLAATPNVPRSLTAQHYLVKQGLIGWSFANGKPLFISRMNPDTPDHCLFAPSESLPHHGSLWCLPARLSLGHSVAFAFLSRNPVDWAKDYQSAISHALHFFQLTLEQFFYQDQVRGLKTFDLTTGLLNPFTFESRLETLASASMQNSTPFTLALLQVEPWQVLHSKLSPGQVRQWQIDVAAALCEAAPPAPSWGS